MNEINTTALAADVLLRMIFYAVLNGGVMAVMFGLAYLVAEKLLGRGRK